MNEFLLFAIVVVYLAIRYGRPTSETHSDQRSQQTERLSRATAAKRNR